MKKFKLGVMLSTLVAVAIMMASCGKKMNALENSMFSVNPSPLELVGTKVPVTINGKVPAKWFNKDVQVEVTPVLKYNGGEALGTTHILQGENVMGNGTVISFDNGGAITFRSSFDYVDAMKKSELFLRFKAIQKGKTLEGFPDIKIADGVLASAALASASTTTPSIAPDAFQRIIKETYDADIMFLIQQAELRSNQLNSSNLKAWKDLVKEAEGNDRKNVDVEIAAYASPDGGIELNEKIAERREANTNKYLTKEFKNEKIDTEINARYTAQDWEGFQKLVQASSLQDKDLVLRVLSMYSDPVVREREIKNISAVYSDLAETILPKLRRSRLIANVEVIGKTDEEIKAAVNAGMGDLSLEESLYSATLDGVSKENVYAYVTKKFPNDYRGWNNLGAVHFQNGKMDQANKEFAKARQISVDAVEANANLGLLALANGDITKAEQLLGNASGAAALNEALGLLYIKKGEYSKAENAFGDVKTNNAALAQVLNKNYNKAQKTIKAIEKKDAISYYVAAIIAARTNNASGVAGNLRSALDSGAKRSDLAIDGEFAKFLTNSDVRNLLGN